MESTPLRDGDFDVVSVRVTELKSFGWKETQIMGYLRPSFPGLTRDILREIMKGQVEKAKAMRV